MSRMSDDTRPNRPHAEPVRYDNDVARSRLLSDPQTRRMRRLWRTLPGGQRCKICTSPFGAPFGPVLRLAGKGRWSGNPAYCGGCFRELYTHRAGAEVECTLFFADVRGSTALAETMPPTDFRRLMDRFYATAADILVRHEAVVDKFVGDEVVAIFIPAMAGTDHARSAIDAGLALLRATSGDGPGAVPIGIGINMGVAYVGAVGPAEHIEFTALGDAVKVAARLASAAGAGELLVTEPTAVVGGLPSAGLEHRSLDLKGKSAATPVVVLAAGSSEAGEG
jgi:adenylate cyclase